MSKTKAAPPKSKKRGYLAKDDRHKALVRTAAEVVEKQGWQALSMISVAEEAQLSAQLIYEHFDSVDELMTETMSEIFRDAYEATRDAIQHGSGNIVDLLELSERMTFDIPPARVRALWQMITGRYSDNGETARRRRRLA